MKEEYKNFGRRLLYPLTYIAIRLHITPNILTIASLPMSILAGFFFARGHWWTGIIFLLFVGLLHRHRRQRDSQGMSSSLVVRNAGNENSNTLRWTR